MNLPKSHFSYSQLNLWEQSKTQYIQRYFKNEPYHETPELKFGKEFAKRLETSDVFGCEEKLSQALTATQKHLFKTREQKLTNELQKIPLLSFLDSSKEDLSEIVEIKTGKKAWDQARVNQHAQLDFYALQAKLTTGKLPEKIKLIWVETKNAGQQTAGWYEIVPTGRVAVFERQVTESELKTLELRIIQVVQEISAAYTSFQNEGVRQINHAKLKKYAEISQQVKKLKTQSEQLAGEILTEFERYHVPSLKLTGLGNFFLQTRKKFCFTKEDAEVVEDYKRQLKVAEESAKKNAQVEEIRALSFRGE